MCSKLNRTGFTKKLLGVVTVAMMSSTAVYASQLPSKSNLSINQGTSGFVEPLPGTGSWFAMEALGPGGWVYTGIGGNEGLLLGGTAQFSRAENVAPELTEVSSVDNSWSFFGSLGLHGHTGVVISDNATVGTADLVSKAIQDELDKRNMQVEFDVVSNPEFLKEGAAIDDFMKPDRVIIGTTNPAVREIMKQLSITLGQV